MSHIATKSYEFHDDPPPASALCAVAGKPCNRNPTGGTVPSPNHLIPKSSLVSAFRWNHCLIRALQPMRSEPTHAFLWEEFAGLGTFGHAAKAIVAADPSLFSVTLMASGDISSAARHACRTSDTTSCIFGNILDLLPDKIRRQCESLTIESAGASTHTPNCSCAANARNDEDDMHAIVLCGTVCYEAHGRRTHSQTHLSPTHAHESSRHNRSSPSSSPLSTIHANLCTNAHRHTHTPPPYHTYTRRWISLALRFWLLRAAVVHHLHLRRCPTQMATPQVRRRLRHRARRRTRHRRHPRCRPVLIQPTPPPYRNSRWLQWNPSSIRYIV
jgi:hypothetical protein